MKQMHFFSRGNIVSQDRSIDNPDLIFIFKSRNLDKLGDSEGLTTTYNAVMLN